jgi:hypothetical protein
MIYRMMTSAMGSTIYDWRSRQLAGC